MSGPCRAKNPHRPLATCGLKEGHHGYHRWPLARNCSHPMSKPYQERKSGRWWEVCMTCGAYTKFPEEIR